MKTILMTVPTCSLPAIVGLNFVLANVGWALTLSTQLEISRRAEVKQQTSADSVNLSQRTFLVSALLHSWMRSCSVLGSLSTECWAGLGFVNCFQAVSGPGPGQVQAEHQLIIRDNTMPPQKLSIPTLQPATSHTCTGPTSVLTQPSC